MVNTIPTYFDVRRLVTYHDSGLTYIFDAIDKRGEGKFFPINVADAKIETFTDKTIISFDSAECQVISSKLGLTLSCKEGKKEDKIWK